MKKLLLAAFGLVAGLGMAEVSHSGAGQVQQPGGPGSEPFTIPAGKPVQGSGQAPYLPTTPGFQNLPAPSSPGTDVGTTGLLHTKEYLDSSFQDPNQDIAVNPGCGNWLISVIWYSGNDAPKMAREMVMELRNNPEYKLHAYVFTKGIEERKAELKRINEAREQIRKLLADHNAPPDTPIRVPVVRSLCEIQCLVLVGGYKDKESARRDLDRLKNLKPPDPNKVKLHIRYKVNIDDKGQTKDGDYVPANPFLEAFPAPNPCKPPQLAQRSNAEDMTLLKSLNGNEPYSLLKCPKKYTLAVKQFSVPVVIQSNKTSSTIFGKIGFGDWGNKTDAAAVSAHNLADFLHKGKFEAYVLHMQYASVVTVGSYDSPDDPRLLRDQERLPLLNTDLHEAIKLARPTVMPVPK